MTPQQRDALNRFLAETVLGWQFGQPPPDGFFCRSAQTMDAPVWIKKPSGWQCGLCDSIPDFTQWVDCKPLLDKIEEDGWCWSWLSSTRDYMVTVYRRDGGAKKKGVSEISTDRTEALCLAIARAYNWKEDV